MSFELSLLQVRREFDAPNLPTHRIITCIRIEKIIYEIVTLSNPTVCNRFLRTVDTRPASFFAAQVKSLCIPIDIEHSTARRILSVCQGVINLAFWLMDGPPLFDLISSLRPRRLSVNIRGLFGSDEQPDFSHPFFSDVTHLEFVDRWSSWTSWSRFEFLPHLTHLAVDVAYYSDGEDALISLRLRQILTSCHSLLVCLVLVPDDDAMINVSNALTRNRIDDLRLVILSDPDAVENWEASLRGATDVCQWAFAEGIVATKIRE